MHKIRLKMNNSKTEFILIGTSKHLASECATKSITIGNSSIKASEYVHSQVENISVGNAEQHMSQLYNISRIRVYLDDVGDELLIQALVHSIS